LAGEKRWEKTDIGISIAKWVYIASLDHSEDNSTNQDMAMDEQETVS